MISVKSENGRAKLVETSTGNIECDYFVNCAGFWSRHVGQNSHPYVRVPIYAAAHYSMYTETITGLNPDLPGRHFGPIREMN